MCKLATALRENYRMIEHCCQEGNDTVDFCSDEPSFMCRSEGDFRLQVFVAFRSLYSKFCVYTLNYATRNVLFHSSQ